MASDKKDDPRNLSLREDTVELVKSFLRDRIHHFPRGDLIRQLEKLDKFYHMQARRDSDDDDFNSRYKDIDVGIVNPTAETDIAFYVDTYLTSSPIFTGVSRREHMDVAKAVESKMHADDMTFGWRAELTKFFRNISKHNKGLLLADWDEDLSYQVAGNLTDNGQVGAETVAYAGNNLRNISLYNAFWDHTVPLTALHKKGEFVGEVEMLTYLELAERNIKFGYRMTKEVWASTAASSSMAQGTSTTNNGKYHFPEIFAEEENLKKEMDWLAFAGYGNTTSESGKYKDAKRMYEVHTFHVRTIPSMLEIRGIPAADRPQLFRIVTVNGHVVQIFHLTNFHNRLPVLGAQVVEDDVELLTQGPAQLAMSYQELLKQLTDRQLAILDRLIADRGLYDPQLVDSESISSPVPDAKIPARPSAKDGLSGAYYQIPYNPNGFFEIGNLMQSIKQMSDEATGVNPAQKGNFVQGNKTLGEWQDVMQGANAKPFARAMVLESVFFAPLKMILKSNLLQYTTAEQEIYSVADSDTVKYDPALVRSHLVDIKLTDGLNSAAKLLKTGGLEYMLQMLMQFQGQIGLEFDISGVFSHLLMQGKGVDIRDYRLTPEQKSQMLAAQNAGNLPQGGQNG